MCSAVVDRERGSAARRDFVVVPKEEEEKEVVTLSMGVCSTGWGVGSQKRRPQWLWVGGRISIAFNRGVF